MSDVVIIGGGAIGCLTARELAAEGQKITILDKSRLASESSWAGGGIVSPLYPWRYLDSITSLAIWSQNIYPSLTNELLENTGIDPELTNSGLLMATSEESDTAAKWAKSFEYNLETIDSKRFIEIEPGYSSPPDEAVWMPGINQLRNPRLAKALIADLHKKQVKTLENTSVTHFEAKSGRIKGVGTTTGGIEADVFIACAGAWTHDLLKDFVEPPDIRPMRGQMLLFKAEPGVVKHMVLDENRYAIPRRDGRVLFGSTIEDVGFEKVTTQSAYDELYEIATSRFPALKKFPVEKHWAGLRPASPAGVPYICRHPEIENLFINAGQFRNGIVLGPASARLAADLALDREPILDPMPYGLAAARG